ncbi:DUF2231 domain-containing protein [Alteromonas ponticola]|uniref:DUF2231 domain-containing protein n=1 Tax=Alteromonas ponticola TaxID=2720613 RepID=A0ABX1QYU3_9ALTE|nr:DUF2231 domain-containing protein [Alteromonas ponticola]NMH59387.1 DUF2231 domain-containing protein [Alteromonas ponticola]
MLREEKIDSRSLIKGHPLHPALIHFPVALLLLLVVTDICYIFTYDPFWGKAGFYLSTTGLLFGVLGSIPGAIDVFSVKRIRRIVSAWAHGLLAIMSLSLATLNVMLRLGDDPAHQIMPWGLYVSLLTAVMINITGSLGAQLVYEYGIGVDVVQKDDHLVDP